MAENRIDIEAALGRLINLTGKMRMLSHRVALAAQQSLLSADTREQAAAVYTGALDEFATIYRALQHGDAALGIPAEAASLAVEAGATDKQNGAVVDRFLSDAIRFRDHVETGVIDTRALTAFTVFVTGDLLSTLNKITQAVGSALQGRLDAQRAQATDARAAMLSAVRSIGDVSMQVKVISLNASVEAARAGEFGKGFAVIATEIRALSESAANTSNLIADYIRKLS